MIRKNPNKIVKGFGGKRATSASPKKALITGITGQDGSHLADFLIAKGYEVHGIIRRGSTFNTSRIDHLYTDPHINDTKLFLHFGDLGDTSSIRGILSKVKPDEFYNLGAQSHVRVSFDVPEFTGDITGLGVLRVLEALKDFEKDAGKKVKMYQASSSEMFGSAPPPQNELARFQPRSPYGVAKVFGYYAVVNYREAYGMFASNGILFNHESERRGETFVTRKIAKAVARIEAGLQDKLFLGNLDARRDWGYAPEYVEAMWMMLQHDTPDDFVIGTGTSHSVRDFVDAAFRQVGVEKWEKYIDIDPRYYRPSEVDNLIADTSKAEKVLGWKAATTFEELVARMVEHERKTIHSKS